MKKREKKEKRKKIVSQKECTKSTLMKFDLSDASKKYFRSRNLQLRSQTIDALISNIRFILIPTALIQSYDRKNST